MFQHDNARLHVARIFTQFLEAENVPVLPWPSIFPDMFFYLPREFSSILFVAIYVPPQTDAGTKTALSQLYKKISKQETTQPEVALLVAGDFNAGKLK